MIQVMKSLESIIKTLANATEEQVDSVARFCHESITKKAKEAGNLEVVRLGRREGKTSLAIFRALQDVFVNGKKVVAIFQDTQLQCDILAKRIIQLLTALGVDVNLRRNKFNIASSIVLPNHALILFHDACWGHTLRDTLREMTLVDTAILDIMENFILSNEAAIRDFVRRGADALLLPNYEDAEN